MYLNTIKPAKGAKTVAKRVGRGMGSGLGKTCGRGHKGQHARSGGYHKVGFEGGQMPIQRRLPKFGFRSKTNRFTEELRLADLAKLDSVEVDLLALISTGLVPPDTRKVRLIATGEVDRAYKISGVTVTKGAKALIEQAGGEVGPA